MMWPLVLFVLGGTAHAQTSLNGTPTWAVLDFENHSGYGGAEVGRIASDAFVVELGKSNKYEVLSRAETLAGVANIGLTQPLDVIGLQRLGRDRGVAAVATGEVAAVSFSNNPRQATASVIIRVVDTNTGELVNGALAQGRSNPRAIGSSDDDALVNEAINNAAFAAVRQITQFNLPKATVLISRDQDSVVLNRGTRDGLFDGLNMVVTRNGSEVGRIRVTDAQADQSTAAVTRRGLGIQPQDRATAIYQLPEYNVVNRNLVARDTDVSKDGGGGGGSHKRSIFTGITGLILAILAGALLLSFIRRGSSSGSLGGATVGKASAIEGRQDVLGGQGFPPLTTFVGTINPTPGGSSITQFQNVVVRITATTGNISINNFLEFHVYRSDFPQILQNGGLATGGNTGGNNTAPIGFGQVPLFTSTGRNALVEFDDGADKEIPPATKPLLNIGTTGGSGGGNNTGNGVQTTPTFFATGTGISAYGARLQYFIEGLYIQPATTGGSSSNPGAPGNTGTSNTSGNGNTGNTGGNTSGSTSGNTTGNGGHPQTFQLTGRTPTNFITYIDPVFLRAASGQTSPSQSSRIYSPSGNPSTDTLVNVGATPGADDYVLELSTSMGFEHKTVLTPGQTGSSTTGPFRGDPLAPQAAPETDMQITSIIWNLRNGTSLKALFGGANQVFARVGARDSRNGPDQGANPYVYSDPAQVPTQ